MSELLSVEQVIELFARCVYLLQMTAQTDWLQLDLTIAQVKVLFVLFWHESLTVSELADRLGVGQPTASHLADRLVQARWLWRQESPVDRRYTLLQLTEQGRDMVERLRQGRVEQLHQRLRYLSSDELLSIQQGMQVLAQALEIPSHTAVSDQASLCRKHLADH